jgi:hypothetical protein
MICEIFLLIILLLNQVEKFEDIIEKTSPIQQTIHNPQNPIIENIKKDKKRKKEDDKVS